MSRGNRTGDARPHVVHIIDELPADGAERLIVDVLQHRSENYRYSVLCLVAGGAMEAELAAMNIPVTILARRPGLDVGTVPVLIRWFKRNDVAIVHTHLYAADSYGRLAAWLAGVPGRFSTRHNTSSWKGYLRNALARGLSRLSTRVIACGGEIGRSMIDQEHLPPDKVVVVANGINLRRFDRTDRSAFRKELGIADDCVLLGVVGRLHPQKGHLCLLEALTKLSGATPAFLCVLIGSGVMHDEIRDAIQRLGLSQRVIMTGQRSDIPEVLAALDVLVMPSLWEGLPMALLEAMASHTAVVATAVGAIPDVIDDGVNGLLVPPNDSSSLHAALTRILGDAALRGALAQAARSTVEQRFNAAQTAARYEALYADALGAEAASA